VGVFSFCSLAHRDKDSSCLSIFFGQAKKNENRLINNIDLEISIPKWIYNYA